jgi:hypothetical protein
MADAGELGKLPPEIRKEIYAYLLVEHRKIGILRQQAKKQDGSVARIDHHRNKNHRGKFYDRETREWEDARPCITSLLFVNKSVNAEATQVLYGFNEFEFVHAGALECFLRHVGLARQHIRSITLIGQGVLFKSGWAALNRSMKLLARATSLRSLQIHHLVLCGEHGSNGAAQEPIADPKTLVQHCKPLLKALQASLKKQNLSLSIFDVIKVFLPQCTYDDDSRDESYHSGRHTPYGGVFFSAADVHVKHRRMVVTSGPRYRDYEMFLCNCVCEAAETKNRRLLEEVKVEIAEQLGLSIGENQNEAVE